MAANFPTSLDDAAGVGSGTGPVPDTTDTTNAPSHAALHQKTGDAVVAVESKVGTGASTPAANKVLTGTGSGTSAWATVGSSMLTAGAVNNAALASSGLSASKLTAGTLPTAQLDTVAFDGGRSSALSVVSGVLTDVALTNEITDTHNGHATSATSWTVPSGEAGWYHISWTFTFASGATGLFGRIVAAATAYWIAGQDAPALGGSGSLVLNLSAGNTVYGSVYQASGSAKNLNSCKLTVLRLR